MEELNQTVEAIVKELHSSVNEMELACKNEDYVQIQAMSQRISGVNTVLNILLTRQFK